MAANETSLVFNVLARDNASRSLHDVGGAALEASGSLKDLSAKLKDVNGRTAAARVGLKGDKEAQHELDRLDVKLDRLGAKHATATVGVSGGRGGLFGKLAGLFGAGAGGAAGGAASGGAQAAGGAGSAIFSNPYSATAAVAAALTSLPFLAQAASGGIVTALGGGITAVAVKFAAKDKEVQKQFHQLGDAAGKDMTRISRPFVKVLDDIAKAGKTTLPRIMKPLGDAIKTIAGPFDKFATALVRAFGSKAVGDSLKAVGKAFGAILTALTPVMPKIITGIAGGIKSIANAITKNPKAFSTFIQFLGDVAIFGLHAIAWLTNVATYLEKNFVPALKRYRKNWDQLWNDSIGVLIRFCHDVEKIFADFRHRTAVIFDGARHDIAHTWDQIWNNTIGRVKRGIADTVGWFKGLPGKAVGALFGMGHSLAKFAHDAIGQMWTGFKGVWTSVIKWFTGLPRMILHALGIHSPPHWAIDAGKHIMAGLHIGLGHGLGSLMSFTTSIGARVAAGLSGALSGGMGDSGARTHSAAVAQRYAASILGQYGWSQSQMRSLIPLWNQESGWSAWAVNALSGAYGIPQSLGHGHPYNLGDYVNQIIWGLNYIRGRYGSPAAAWAHEQRFNWYGGGLDAVISRPTLIGVGERGPEHVQVTPRGGSSAQEALLGEIADGQSEIISLLRSAPHHTGRALGDALNGVARSSAYSSMYGSR